MFKKVTLLFVLLGGIISIGFIYYNNETKEEKIHNIMDQVTLTLDSELNLHKMDDLTMALFFSQNTGIVNALENDDEDLGYQILSNITEKIKKHTGMVVRAQIITNEYNIFARSWDDIYAGMPIGEYRSDFDYFKTHKTPRTSIEVGRRLGIKATVPIYKDEKFLGFVEVISFFKSMTNFFSSIGVDFYAFLDVKYTDSAVLMMQNLTIGEYIVANRNYNSNHVQTLNKINFKELKKGKILHVDEKYIFFETMYDGERKAIGAFIFVLPERYLEYFRNQEDDISFLINVTRSGLYDVIKEEKYEKNLYNKYSANSMVYLQDAISKEDKQVFLDEAYEKFDEFTKDELIQMMLNRKIVKKIDGKIQ